jgi:anthranilate/para-aminobenzoate synthase component II
VALAPDAVLLSPGPGRPEDAGIICAAIPAFGAAGVPVLGVCLGHQAIGHVYGGSVVRAPT